MLPAARHRRYVELAPVPAVVPALGKAAEGWLRAAVLSPAASGRAQRSRRWFRHRPMSAWSREDRVAHAAAGFQAMAVQALEWDQFERGWPEQGAAPHCPRRHWRNPPCRSCRRQGPCLPGPIHRRPKTRSRKVTGQSVSSARYTFNPAPANRLRGNLEAMSHDPPDNWLSGADTVDSTDP
jgi:hypothetical protein